jgi:hypothetical protein
LLWSYVALLSALVTCALVFGLVRLGNLAPLVIVYGLPPLNLIAASIGLWNMRKWGGLLYGLYLGLEGARSLSISNSIPFVLLPIGMTLVDTRRGQALAGQYNAVYLVCIVGIGLGIGYLWQRGRLT